jgi:hypothetical protein
MQVRQWLRNEASYIQSPWLLGTFGLSDRMHSCESVLDWIQSDSG